MRKNSALLLAPFLALALGIPSNAQGPATALPERTNSLGMRFLPVSSLPVLISQFETRQADFSQFLSASSLSWEQKPHFQQTEQDPVVNVTLEEATAFCAWLTEKERAAGQISATQSYRLPTNAEWSAAAGLASDATLGTSIDERLEGERVYPWGEQWPPPQGAGNLAATEIDGYDEAYPFTSPVGKFAPNKFGLHDLSGNAWEWCRDGGSATNRTAILRGGSWVYFRPEYLLAAYRYEVPADLRASTFGFRCAFEDSAVSKQMKTTSSATVTDLVSERSADLLGREDEDQTGEGTLDSAKNRFLPGRESGGSESGELNLRTGVTPPTGAAPHTNMMGMQFLPIGGGKLLCRNETMIREFEQFIKETRTPWPKRPSFTQKPTHPAAGITWEQADAFCRWLTTFERERGAIAASQLYRLPTDAEWSIAVGLPAEAGATPQAKMEAASKVFPWGTQWPPPPFAGNFDASKIAEFQDRSSYTSPAGQHTESTGGFFDLAGNVAEWCSDNWSGSSKILRGSSWLDSEQAALYSGHRKGMEPNETRPDIGFRCVLQAQ